MLKVKEKNPVTGLEIAVIGMAGRFPGAKNIHEFWENLKNGVESISFFSDDELEKAGVSRELLKNPNFVKGKGVIADIEYFDSSFFNYTSREAEILDPQVRIFHECAWSALEDAGYDPEVNEGRIGLYAGASSNQTWEGFCIFSGKGKEVGEWESTLLMDKDYMSVRISYKLNLKGPSFIMQSACSTSLAAVHLGCRALLTGECDMALVGGVSISAARASGYLYQEGMILSPDGHCRAFDAQASGTVGGEGIGIAVLKRLDDAVTSRDNIYAVVKGSVINNDGKRKIGFSAPSIDGQTECIRSALHLSRINPEKISYVETHGTGTILGDPIEIEALRLAFNTEKKKYCGIGSVKTNIGHLDVAAGISGFIKAVLVIKNKLIPPSLHFQVPNPKIDFDNSPFYVNNELKEWKNDEIPFCAGVSSFGIGGTNVHVILEEGPEVAPGEAAASIGEADYRLLLLSARSWTAVDKMAFNLAGYLKSNPGINFADAAYTLQVGRKAFTHRKMTVCRGTAEAAALLSSPGAGKVHAHLAVKENLPVIFMFPGQGAQYVNMGLELYKTEVVFRQEMDHCFEILKSLMACDIKEIIYPGSGNNGLTSSFSANIIDQTQITQPVIFIFEYALAKLLMAWGIKPYAMIGHSIGEYTAACLAGIFSLEDALHLVVWRGKLMQKIPPGAMLGVPLPEEELLPFLNEQISLAAVNSSSLCVVSGTFEAMDRLAEDMKKRGYETSRLHTSHAFHSAMMEPILDEFEAQVKNIKFNKPQLPYISNVSGKWLTSDEGNNPGYWKKHLRETVRFSWGLEELLKENNSIFIEVGPGKVLSTFVRQHSCKKDGHHTVNLIRHPKEDIPDRYWLLNALGQAWLYGAKIDWEKCWAFEKSYRVSLPTYPFEGQRYWIDSHLAKMGTIIPSQDTALSKKEDIADWFYLPTWERALLPRESNKKRGTAGQQSWLILMDAYNAGKELAGRLEANGEEVICAGIGKEFQRTGDREYIIDPGKPGDYIALFKDLKERGKVPGTIIHLFLLSPDREQETGFDTASLEMNFDRGFYSLIYLAQAIDKQDITGKIRIEVVTNEMQDITGEENLNPAKSILLGACKTIPQEYPGISCRSIDIVFTGSGGPAEAHLFDQLITEFKSENTCTVLAYRNNRRWDQVFEPLRLEKENNENQRLRPNGVYLITGGLGKIGLSTAGYLAAKVKAKLILISRSDFPARDKWDQWLKIHDEKNKESRTINKIKDFERLGAEVLVFSADVSDEIRMQEVIAHAEQHFGPLNGVIHAAGVLAGESYRLIKDIDKNVCKLQFQPKISGVLVLDKLLKDKNLDFCLLTSSLSAVLGGLTFSAYSAANLFMDAFVAWRNKLNPPQPWISVNWDGWREEDATLNNSNLSDLAMRPEEGIEVLERILSCEGLMHVVNSLGDLNARIRKWINLDSIKEKENDPTLESAGALYSRPNLTNTYVPPNTQVELDLCKIWQDLFGFQQVGIHDNFFELGGDSLKAINMSAKIHKALNMKLTLAEFFNRQTIAELAEYIANNKKTEFFSIDYAEKKEYYELSPGQKRLYILKQMDVEGTSYNLPEFMILEMELAPGKLEEAFRKLIKRHETLRTSFQLVMEEPVQRIYNDVDFTIEYYEPTIKNENNTIDQSIVDKIIKGFVRTFDLSRPPLFRVGLMKLGENRYLLLKDMHHIISDAISHNIFIRDLLMFYNENELTGLNFQYKDFSEWQKKLGAETGGVLKKQEEFWMADFSGEIPILNFPTDYPRPLVQSFEGRHFDFEIGEEETGKLRKIALQEGATLYILLLTAFNILLSKISGQEDIIVGTPVMGRRHVDFQQVIGLFINTLALRNYPVGEKSLREFLGAVKKKTLDAFENQEYPFEELVEKSPVKRDVSRNPLFDVMILLQGMDGREFKSEEPLQVKAYNYDNQASKFDLSLLVIEREEKLLLTFEYCVKLFKEETIRTFSRYLGKILRGMMAEPDRKLFEIEIMENDEKLRILEAFNRTQKDYPEVEGMHHLFEMEVKALPGNTALVYEQEHMTGGYLDLKATMLAAILAKKGVKTGVVVGVMVERSIEMIVGILGLLKAGGIYLPIDTELPVDRKKYMLEDSGAKLILSKQQIPHILGDTREVVYLENGQSYNNAGANLDIRVEREATAYVIYTSGSTGKPKGVAVRHRSILNTLMWRKECYKFDRNDIVLQIPSISFDSSVEDIFNALSSGSKLVLIKQSERLNLEYLDTVIAKERITHFLITPALYTVFLEKIPNRLSSLKTVTVAGESFTENLVEEHFKKLKNTRIFNEYGPTENSVCTTVYEFTGDNPKISIGKPISNVTCYILDKYRRVIPLGLFGELCVSGKGLAAGYLNNQELTDLKFVSNHYTEQDLLYCTGDLCRWSPDGNIEFLGRVDSQVKIRGFRIELEEIEKSILNFPGIKETVVSVREQENGDKYLCAYIVPGIEFEKSKLSEYLAKELPGYMIPSYFIPLDRIPLTPNGKIDRRALPKPEIESGKDYIAPRDVVEEKLAGIWAGVLFEKSSLPGTPGRIGMDDNFFQLGGHSLKAVIMLSKLHRELNVKVPLAEIFKNPTLEGLAAYIKKTAPDRYVSIEPIEKKEYYALSSAQKRLYILQQMDRKSTAYNMLEILPLTNAPDLTKLKKAFMHLITRHESLRTFFQIVDDQPVQRINDVVNFTIGYNEINADNQVQVEVVKLFDQAFNLAHSPMLRVEIIKTAPAQYFMVLVMHHIISDGISIQVLVHDLMILSTDDHENILPPLRVQYKDFSHWQNNEKNKASMKTQETYWLKEFEGKVPVLTLPTDFPRPDIQLFKGGVLNGEIAVDIAPFKTIAMENGATTFMVLLTIFYVFIYKISGQEDIIIGTPVAGRRHVDLEKIIGMFVNSLPLRNRPGDEKSFVELLQEVRSNTLAAFENQDYQFEDLVEKLAVNRDQRNPIFDVMFIYQEKEFAGKINADTNDYVGSRTSKFDLTLNIMIAGKLWFSFEYSSELFKKKTIERFAQCFKEIVFAVLTDKNSKLKNINITTFLADTTGSEVQEELLGMDF